MRFIRNPHILLRFRLRQSCLQHPIAAAVELTLWHHTYPPAREFIEKKAAEFTTKNPDITIKLHDDPHGTTKSSCWQPLPPETHQTSSTSSTISSRNMPAAAFSPKSTTLPSALATPPLSKRSTSRRPSLALTINGKVYGVPEEFNTLALFINKHTLRMPASMPMTRQAGRRRGTSPRHLHQAYQGRRALASASTGSGTWIRTGMRSSTGRSLQQYGCDVVDADGKAVINSNACVKAFTETWQALIDKKIGGPTMATVNPVNALQDFSDGRQSMAIAVFGRRHCFRCGQRSVCRGTAAAA